MATLSKLVITSIIKTFTQSVTQSVKAKGFSDNYCQYIILIEIRMAREVPIHGGVIRSQILAQATIHTYLGKELTFVNTVIMQTNKLIAPNIMPIIHEHPHPQNALTSCPFAIINGKYPKDKGQIYKLLLVLLQVSDFAVHHPGEDYNYQNTEIGFAMSALLKMCEQLADLSTVLNEDDVNPFYLFLNPILKYRQHCKMTDLKNKITANTQFLDKFGKLNIDYFLYKLNTLEAYLVQLQKKRKSLAQAKFIKICIIALLKHFTVNNKKMLQAAIQLPTFNLINSKMIQTLTDLSEFYEKAVQQKRQAVSYYSNFVITDEKAQRQGGDLQPFKETMTRAIVKPIAVTFVLVTLYRIFSS